MIDKRLGCLLLGLGVLAGCHPSRSEYIKMPRNPQHAKVQTPVLHPTPAPPRATSPYAPYRQTMPVTTMSTTTQPVQTWQPQVHSQTQTQPLTTVTQDVKTPIMPTVLNEPVVVSEQASPVTDVPTSETKVDYTWIKSADGSSTSPTIQPSTLPDVQQSDALVLLPIEQSQLQSQPYQPTSQPGVTTTTTSPILQKIMAESQASHTQTSLAAEHEKQREELLVLLDVDPQDENAALGEDVADPAEDVMDLAEEQNSPSIASPTPTQPDSKQVNDETAASQEQSATQSVTTEQASSTEPDAMDETDRAIAALLATPAPVSQQTLVMAEPQVEPVSVPQPVVQTKPDVYQVHKGDTLWSIARRFYGNGQRWLDIARSNGIRHADALRVGQTLKLPD